MLNIPGTVLITKKEVTLHEEQKEKEVANNWFYYSRASITLPPLTPLLLLELKHNPKARSSLKKNKPTPGSKSQKILRFLYDNEYYTCEMSDGQIKKFFGYIKNYQSIKKALECNKEQKK
jgi:hypothetical protein